MNLQINLPDISLAVDFTILFKMALSIAIGYALGRERKAHDKSAGGSRTMAMVSLGACLIAILTLTIQDMNPAIQNFTRLLASGIGGISFIGAGISWKNSKGLEGLTTAATLWALLPINYFIGLGVYYIGIFGALFSWLILESKYKKRRIK